MQQGKEDFFMNNKQDSKQTVRKSTGIAIFGNIKVMVCAALLAAISIVLGKYLAVNPTIFIRISFENLPILMAGMFFSPVIGGVVGAAADLIGCFMVGYSINPIITLGAALIGVISGIVSKFAFKNRDGWRGTWRIFIPVMSAHAISSMCVKSIGMAIYYGTPVETLLWRIPLYIVVGTVEGYIIMLLFRNKNFSGLLAKILSKKKVQK